MKKGVSLVALIITIIVLIILTAAVVLTGVNTPQEAQLAVFYNNVSTVQEAVRLQMNSNLTKYVSRGTSNLLKYKWVGVVKAYTEANAQSGTNPVFNAKIIEGINVAKIDLSIKKNLTISEEEFNKYYVDEKGIVYYEGFTYNGNTYYNATLVNEQSNDENDSVDNVKPVINVSINEEEDIHTIEVELTDNVGIDLTKCKYVLSLDDEPLGNNLTSYSDGTFVSTTQELKAKVFGIYYLHIIANDVSGNYETYISEPILCSNALNGSIISENTYSYRNNIQSVVLNEGMYTLEAWGAAGGHSKNWAGTSKDMRGGYTKAILVLDSDTELFIVTGGQGETTTTPTKGLGGYNGGGNGGDGGAGYCGGGGGGGATHIALISGLLKDLSNDIEDILIVAGGAGGSTNDGQNGGVGGGINGADGYTAGQGSALGATQTTGFAFGLGQNGISKTQYNSTGAEGNAGGGGGFYGGFASQLRGITGCNAGGGGGSAYINNGLFEGSTIAGMGSTTNGYAKITKSEFGYQYINE